ncbi:MAG: PTS IIA-like nitrogen-regulatory protein PtsN [Alphaproteobacteria bacterium]|jgi:PTS system nitrogen regulatory IIA component|nr:PTS IIA-like nitrogen regulatory protein PtsN [Beijerinckiaceae bacterium]NBQ39269.1 PTS IIA-like nitrogen-regulatory protein PtsN [Alphaproteobacteria bacterium]
MPLTDILTPQSVLASVKAVSKKQLLQELSAFAAAQSGLLESDIYEALLQRERLGSTGIGHGIAIPHGKLPKLDRLIGIFARLEKPVDFDALDGQQVDLVFLLLAPEGAGADHLKALSRVARALRDPAIAQKLRKSHDASALFALLTQAPTATAA